MKWYDVTDVIGTTIARGLDEAVEIAANIVEDVKNDMPPNVGPLNPNDDIIINPTEDEAPEDGEGSEPPSEGNEDQTEVPEDGEVSEPPSEGNEDQNEAPEDGEGNETPFEGNEDQTEVPEDGEVSEPPSEGNEDQTEAPEDGEGSESPSEGNEDQTEAPEDGEGSESPSEGNEDQNEAPEDGEGSEPPSEGNEDQNEVPEDGEGSEPPSEGNEDQNEVPEDGERSETPEDGNENEHPTGGYQPLPNPDIGEPISEEVPMATHVEKESLPPSDTMSSLESEPVVPVQTEVESTPNVSDSSFPGFVCKDAKNGILLLVSNDTNMSYLFKDNALYRYNADSNSYYHCCMDKNGNYYEVMMNDRMLNDVFGNIRLNSNGFFEMNETVRNVTSVDQQVNVSQKESTNKRDVTENETNNEVRQVKHFSTSKISVSNFAQKDDFSPNPHYKSGDKPTKTLSDSEKLESETSNGIAVEDVSSHWKFPVAEKQDEPVVIGNILDYKNFVESKLQNTSADEVSEQKPLDMYSDMHTFLSSQQDEVDSSANGIKQDKTEERVNKLFEEFDILKLNEDEMESSVQDNQLC